MKRFADLSEQEILALAITNEEEDSRIYRGFAEGLREKYAASAKVFDEMAEEEVRHRTMLFDLYRATFGEYLALILIATIGMMFLVASQNILLIFISLELLSLSLYILAAFNKRSGHSAEAALKYFLFGGASATRSHARCVPRRICGKVGMSRIGDTDGRCGGLVAPLQLDSVRGTGDGATEDIESWPHIADAARRRDANATRVCYAWHENKIIDTRTPACRTTRRTSHRRARAPHASLAR